MSKKPGEVFRLQIWGHWAGKESRRGDSFTSPLKLWEGREETVEVDGVTEVSLRETGPNPSGTLLPITSQ